MFVCQCLVCCIRLSWLIVGRGVGGGVGLALVWFGLIEGLVGLIDKKYKF